MENRETGNKEAGSLEPVEIEASLAVVSENPEGLLGKIGLLRGIAGFTLVHRSKRIIHDIYFDTPDLLLAEERVALRLRRYDDDLLLTVKGPPEKIDASETAGPSETAEPSETADSTVGIRLFEMEREWSEEMPETVKEILGQRGIALSGSSAKGGVPSKDPVNALKGLGLTVVQDRKTVRGIRDVVTAAGGNGPVLAEMALDTVTYSFQAGGAVHREVEVEAAGPEGIVPMQAVIHGLKEAFGGELRPWNHGKLATGKIIEKMVGAGSLKGLIHETGNLLPAVYDLIEEAVRGRR